MKLTELEQLNNKFSIDNETCQLIFKNGKAGIPVIEIKNQQASAKISLQGAHLLSWVPTGETEVIWLSTDARFEKGKSVRGGIPICWPWFGAHAIHKYFPAHGFARTVIWNVASVKQLATGETQIKFTLHTEQLNSSLQIMWPHNTLVEYVLTIGKNLTLQLITHNNGAENIVIGEALHTYFNIENIKVAKVQGLHGVTYLDKPDDFKPKQQNANIEIAGEIDRVYINAPNVTVIQNQHRKIVIKTQGSDSTIVWNPGKKVAEKMADLGEGGYLQMLCVESGNAADNVVSVAAGESQTLQVSYQIENI